MRTLETSPLSRSNRALRAALCVAGLISATSGSLWAQSYTVVDLTPGAVYANATGLSASLAGGFVAPTLSGPARATAWDGTSTFDLHPDLLTNPATGNVGASTILGVAEGIQVGWGVGNGTAGRQAPMVWHNTAASAALLTIPFVNGGGQALATDGRQIVGYAMGMNRDGTAIDASHAVVWDAVTGVGTDLGDGGGSARANGVGGGVQVGVVNKGSAFAALWRGTDKTLTSLHPVSAVVSYGSATDGARQVGYAGYDVRVRVEAVKGNKNARFNYAFVWSGTAASAQNIHAGATVNGTIYFSNSYALSLAGKRIVGYAVDASKSGALSGNHAIVWDENLLPYDLNAFLPAGFVGAIAYSVNNDGEIAGIMFGADGSRHAALWLPTAAQP